MKRAAVGRGQSISEKVYLEIVEAKKTFWRRIGFIRLKSSQASKKEISLKDEMQIEPTTYILPSRYIR